MHRLTVDEFKAVAKLPLVVVLDNVRSQNNIGSVFRTADAFCVEQICLCGICSTPPHRDIHKTALGAEDSMAWSYFDHTSDCLSQLRADGYRIFAVEQVDDSIKLDDKQLSTYIGEGDKIAVVFGNEVDGVDETLLPMCEGSIEIPQYGTKHSLNVSCTAAIVMWQLQLLMRNK
ncbi:MAG: RNA methyltransferase [Bacteroidales bacterium]|nr:RNA methyltransferase [Candidatus Colimorpha onthohippi]